jgi:CBS domain-containing protein
MAAYTQGRVLGEIPVTAVMARAVKTCRSDEPLAQAMATLHQAQVHRLPVVDGRGLLVGMLSTNDLVRTCQARPAALEAAALVKLLAAIGAPRAAATPLAVAAPAGASAAPAAAAVAAVPPAAVAVATAMPSVAVKAAVGKPVVVPPAAAPATVATPPVASGKGKPAAKGKSKKG